MEQHLYPTVAEAIEIHRQPIDGFGGSHSLRDRGRLQAAIFRPQMAYYDLVDEAAALMESLANNHPFIDGKKQISFALTDTFLRLNGHYLEVDPVATHKFITETTGRGQFRFRILREWIIDHLSQLPR
jgi:death-on-curing protein